MAVGGTSGYFQENTIPQKPWKNSSPRVSHIMTLFDLPLVNLVSSLLLNFILIFIGKRRILGSEKGMASYLERGRFSFAS